ncbi:MAG: rhodanese-like domain-containing protein, partial [Bacteroidota bacterium]
MKAEIFIVILIAVTGVIVFQTKSQESVTTQQAYELIQQDTSVVILDVRTPEEFNSSTGRLKGSILIPVHQLESRLSELE